MPQTATSQAKPQANSEETNLRYSGEFFDKDLKQQYLRARYYNQNNGQFNRLDPYSGDLANPQSLHKYAYCHQDPVNHIDPSGNFSLVETMTAVYVWAGIRAFNFAIAYPVFTATVVAIVKILETLLVLYDAYLLITDENFRETTGVIIMSSPNPLAALEIQVMAIKRAFVSVRGVAKMLSPKNIRKVFDKLKNTRIFSSNSARSGVNTNNSATGNSGTTKTAVRNNYKVYETVSEVKISGASRSGHRASANRNFFKKMKGDSRFKKQMDDLFGQDVMKRMQSGKGKQLINPPGGAWHHPVNNSKTMRLLFKTEHQNPLLQNLLHPGPNGTGGFGQHFGGN